MRDLDKGGRMSIDKTSPAYRAGYDLGRKGLDGELSSRRFSHAQREAFYAGLQDGAYDRTVDEAQHQLFVPGTNWTPEESRAFDDQYTREDA